MLMFYYCVKLKFEVLISTTLFLVLLFCLRDLDY